jgi:hypothetical protein
MDRVYFFFPVFFLAFFLAATASHLRSGFGLGVFMDGRQIQFFAAAIPSSPGIRMPICNQSPSSTTAKCFDALLDRLASRQRKPETTNPFER